MDTRNTESESRNETNETERSSSNTSDANISLKLVKKIFYKHVQRTSKKAFGYCSKCVSDTNARLDWLTQKISNDNIKLNPLSKETDDLKLILETSQEITDNKSKQINPKLKNDKQQHGNEIDKLQQENEYLPERLRYVKDRLRRTLGQSFRLQYKGDSRCEFESSGFSHVKYLQQKLKSNQQVNKLKTISHHQSIKQ